MYANTKSYTFSIMHKQKVTPQPRLTLPQTTIFKSSILKEFADDTFKFDENSGKLSKQVENTEGKGEIAYNEQFLLFPQSFRKTCTPDR